MIISIGFDSRQNYIQNYIKLVADFCSIKIRTVLKDGRIDICADENSENFDLFLRELEDLLPSSVFMGDVKVQKGEFLEDDFPVKIARNLGLCKRCMKELFNPSSRRYYYPFTFCNGCGFAYAFVKSYPYKRENSLLFPFQTCKKCQEETKENPFRKDFPLISCSECAIPVRLENRKKTKVMWANESKEYKDIFSLLALAVSEGDRVLIKTLNGYKIFQKEPAKEMDIFITDANRVKNNFLLLKDEIRALFSIEKPKIKATLADEELQKKIGSVKRLKAADCTVSVLFAKECQNLGVEYLFFKEASLEDDYDLVLDFDLPINEQEDIEYFINKKNMFFAKGDRALYPKFFPFQKSEAVDKPYGALFFGRGTLIDKIDLLPIESGKKFRVFEKKDRGVFAILSVLAENRALDSESVGIYFSKSSFMTFYKDGKIKKIFEFGSYENILDKIKDLREGSDRLIENFKEKMPSLYEKVESLEGEFEDPFYLASVLLDLEGGFEELDRLSLNFSGKGGVAVDCRVSEDGKFDFAAFFASIISYRLAKADKRLIAYSIFESLGEFLGSLANDVKRESKAENIAVCGRYFSNTPFFSRFQRNMIANRVLYNREFAIDDNNIIFGELFG